jgi:hypothetical protein
MVSLECPAAQAPALPRIHQFLMISNYPAAVISIGKFFFFLTLLQIYKF